MLSVAAVLITLCAVVVYISIVFVIAMALRRLDTVDIAWGGAFIVAAITSYLLSHSSGLLQILATTLVFLWGARLAYMILVRFMRSGKEDARYTDLRKKWKGSLALNAYLRIFLTQGLLATVIAASVIYINFSSMQQVGLLALAGALVWCLGFYFETVGDIQLRRHIANPKNKGKLMTSGLWRYTRHPNYFGEATQWWGIWIIATSVPYGWLTIFAPLLITVLLLFVSGVPLTEKSSAKKPGWAAYRNRTSAFLPLPPKNV